MMELTTHGTTQATAAATYIGGSETIIVAAGKTLKVETTPGGVEVLAATVPAGKVWRVVVGIEVVETDA